MKRTEAAKIMAILVAAYPNAQVSEQTSEIYESMLADLDFETCKAAVMRLLAGSKFMPSIAEIRTTAADIQHGPKRLGGEAWGDVVAEIRRVGYIGTPRFSDPCVAEVVRMLGWQQLCKGESSEASDRARFIELYDGLQQRARADVVAGHALPPARGHAALSVPEPGRPALELVGGAGRRMP